MKGTVINIMWKNTCLWVVVINYFIGIISSAYLIGKLLNKVFNFNGGVLVVIAVQCVLGFCLTEVEKFIKENAIKEYKRIHNIE